MEKTITLLPSNHQFRLQGEETILEAALRSGHSPAYGCNNGNCGQCLAKLVSGETRQVRHSDFRLEGQPPGSTTAHRQLLMCCHTALTDLVLHADEASSADDIPLQHIRARIKKIDASDPEVLVVSLQTPRTQTLRFLAGQSIQLTARKKIHGRFHLGNCPCDDRNLQLHLPTSARNTAAALSSATHAELDGPYGDFTLVERPARPALFIASAHGFAPLKSIIEHAIALEYDAPLALFRLDKQPAPYLHNLCRSWQDAFDDFHYQVIARHDTQRLLTTLTPFAKGPVKPVVYLAAPDQAHSLLVGLLNDSFPGLEILHTTVTTPE